MAYIYDLTDTWNAGGTTFNAIKMNVTDSASAVSSKLVSLQTNGTEHFSVTKAGVGYVSGNLGVGTTTPGAKLDVNGQTATGNISVRGDGSEGGQITFSNAANTASALTLDVDNLGHGRLFTTVNNANLSLGQLVGTGGIITLNTAATERMRIDGSGNVGIGTSSPASKLNVASANVTVSAGYGIAWSGDQTRIMTPEDNSYGALINWGAAGGCRFIAGTSERMRIDALGNVGIGTTTPGAQFENVGRTRLGASVAVAAPSSTDILSTSHTAFSGAGGNYLTIGQYPTGQGFAQWIQSSFSNPTTAVYNLVLQPLGGNVGIGLSAPTLAKLQAASAGAGASEIVASNTLGAERIHLISRNSANVSYLQSQNSSFLVGTYDNYSLQFLTNNTERMRITSGGDLLVGQTAGGFSNGNSMTLEPSAGYSVFNHVSGTASGTKYHYFAYAGSEIGSITQNGTTGVLYNTSSDIRLKHDIVDAPEASSLIDAIQVRSFKWNADDSEQRYGFIAQELVTVAPEAVSQPEDPEEMMGVDYSKLVPMLVKEIQSLRARVAQLEGN